MHELLKWKIEHIIVASDNAVPHSLVHNNSLVPRPSYSHGNYMQTVGARENLDLATRLIAFCVAMCTLSLVYRLKCNTCKGCLSQLI